MSSPPDTSPDAPRPVTRRRVFFIPGYDPIRPRRYRELYRKEGARQAGISRYELTVQGQPAVDGLYRWRTQASIDGQNTETEIFFCEWNDIVRASMDRTILSSYWLMLRTFWAYLRSGALLALIRLRPAPMLAALYPVVLLLAQLALAVVVFRLAVVLLPPGIGVLAGAGAFALTLWLFRRYDRYIFAYYLLHDYAFAAENNGQTPAALRDRQRLFAHHITKALSEDVDEVLVIGHSSGAHMGVEVMADVLRMLPDRPKPHLAFLTLGSVIPMVSFLPGATRLRGDLRRLSLSDRITWIDVSAPGDGACFALCDPVCVSGVAPEGAAKRGPKVLSAAFSQTMDPASSRATRWKFFQRHIQYLCAFERPDWYDYFAITAGPVSLHDRYAARGASQSRIETPLAPRQDWTDG